MSKEQWGHGYHTGVEAGIDYGEASGKWSASMDLAEKINFLLVDLLVEGGGCIGGPVMCAIVKTMFDVLRPHLQDPERAKFPIERIKAKAKEMEARPK